MDLGVTYKATDLGVIHNPKTPQEASEGRREEPGSHRPLSLPPVGAKQCQAAEGGENSQVDPSASTCLTLSRTNSLLGCTVNEPATSNLVKTARSNLENDPRKWDPGGTS